MSTTDLSTRVLLTVLLLGPMRGLCHLQRDQGKDNWARTGEIKSDEAETRLLSSIEEPGILLPPEDRYNFVGEDSPETQESTWRNSRGSQFPATTIISTNSYSIRPGGGSSSTSGSGSSVFVNAKPLTIVATGTGYKGQPQSPFSNSKDSYDSPNSKNKDKSTFYVKNNCYGSRCPTTSNKQDYDDENKSYHYIMNKDVKHKLKRYDESPLRRNGEHEDSPLEHHMTLSLPFRVEPAVSQKDLQYPYRFPNQNRNNRRVSRTTTTTPGWVKLQPIFPEQYDIFSLKSNRSHGHNLERQQEMAQNYQFSTRLGVELNPESFADRWGWGSEKHHNHQDKGSGSRLPSWLQEIHSTLQGGPTRDSDNKNWVKLDPIPVAGVSISKWVPKGTSSSELPSTNWPTRDHRPHSSGSSFNSNPNNYANNNQWYDHIDNNNKFSAPTYIPIPVQVQPHSGWGSNKPSHQQSSSSWDRAPTNQWNEVIYPDGPTSATVSWQHDKDLSKYPSSFPISTPSSLSSSWPSDHVRRPATGSWSADKERGRPQFVSQPYGGNRRQGSNSYPDRQTNENDSRWVLVSNSRKVSVSPSESQRHPSSHEYNDASNYRPGFDKYADFPFYYENPHSNRVGKDVKRKFKSGLSTSKTETRNQDDAFNKINATLSSLTPVLSMRGSTIRPPDMTKIRSSTTNKPKRLPAFMKPYAGDGRAVAQAGNNNTHGQYDNLGVTAPSRNVRRGLNINPVYAAVGAGMIPATMAAVLPMMLGRKRRDVLDLKMNSHSLPKLHRQDKETLTPLIFLDYDSYARTPFLISKVYGSDSKNSVGGKYLHKT